MSSRYAMGHIEPTIQSKKDFASAANMANRLIGRPSLSPLIGGSGGVRKIEPIPSNFKIVSSPYHGIVRK